MHICWQPKRLSPRHETFDRGEDPGEANIAKMLADASWEAARLPANPWWFGFAEEYDVERKYRERLYQVAPISTNLILSYIAEHMLGMPKSTDQQTRRECVAVLTLIGT